tara:strand:- start:583 stop:717 length:135 start_codon:yes stop_codon:yes gene_type:complete
MKNSVPKAVLQEVKLVLGVNSEYQRGLKELLEMMELKNDRRKDE